MTTIWQCLKSDSCDELYIITSSRIVRGRVNTPALSRRTAAACRKLCTKTVRKEGLGQLQRIKQIPLLQERGRRVELRNPFLLLSFVHSKIDNWEHLKHTLTLSLYIIFPYGGPCSLLSQNLSN